MQSHVVFEIKFLITNSFFFSCRSVINVPKTNKQFCNMWEFISSFYEVQIKRGKKIRFFYGSISSMNRSNSVKPRLWFLPSLCDPDLLAHFSFHWDIRCLRHFQNPTEGKNKTSQHQPHPLDGSQTGISHREKLTLVL